MSSKRAYSVRIFATATRHGALKTFESYRDAVAFIVGHKAMASMQGEFNYSLSLFGVEMDRAETDSLIEMIVGNTVYAFNKTCAGTKDAEAWL